MGKESCFQKAQTVWCMRAILLRAGGKVRARVSMPTASSYTRDLFGMIHGWGRKFIKYGRNSGTGRGYYTTCATDESRQVFETVGPGKLVEQNGTIYLCTDSGDMFYYEPAAAGGSQGNPASSAQRQAGTPVPSASNPISSPAVSNIDVDGCLAELDSMIGLGGVKRQVRELVNLIRLQKERESRRFPVVPMSYHMVFTGNPGTGKTTVARLMGKIYAGLGIVSKSDVVETDRTGLVGQWIGSTTKITDAKINQARGGILFIDEAYALTPEDDSRDFGKEAVDCLLKRMEDYRDDLVVIVAGYEKPMQRFIDSNPGLKSRFKRYIHFENYDLLELLQILELYCKKGGYILPPETCRHWWTAATST